MDDVAFGMCTTFGVGYREGHVETSRDGKAMAYIRRIGKEDGLRRGSIAEIPDPGIQETGGCGALVQEGYRLSLAVVGVGREMSNRWRVHRNGVDLHTFATRGIRYG